ncbi:site-2 protease family protein [Phaeacidiphilus oryzae]|uniref:site-2 protease family protein n=1 Tax=Phaeacidiphilus oryzae TaxID=348818 RepID=UPI000563F5EE|nr:site-2 protease family protein [Phaeacidiphilus oryzae]
MNGAIPCGRLFGIPLRLHWTVPLLVLFLGYGLGRGTLPAWAPGRSGAAYGLAALVAAAALLPALAAHEFAHALTARRFGVRVEDVTLWALGGVTRMGRAERPRALLAISLAGPLASLVVGGAALGAAAGIGAGSTGGRGALTAAVLAWLGWVDLLLGGFNLLPGAPLDGGRVLQAVLWARGGDPDRSAAQAAAAGRFLGIALVVLGLLSTFTGAAVQGLWLALIGVFLSGAAGAERRSATLAAALRGVLVGQAMSTPVDSGPDWFDLERFVAEVPGARRHSAVPLTDVVGRCSGLVTTARISAVPGERRALVRVRDLAVPAGRCAFAIPGEPLAPALARCTPETGTRLLVVDEPAAGRRLLGIVTEHDVRNLLRGRALDVPASPHRRWENAW